MATGTAIQRRIEEDNGHSVYSQLFSVYKSKEVEMYTIYQGEHCSTSSVADKMPTKNRFFLLITLLFKDTFTSVFIEKKVKKEITK
jgi:hypothetical protein